MYDDPLPPMATFWRTHEPPSGISYTLRAWGGRGGRVCACVEYAAPPNQHVPSPLYGVPPRHDNARHEPVLVRVAHATHELGGSLCVREKGGRREEARRPHPPARPARTWTLGNPDFSIACSANNRRA